MAGYSDRPDVQLGIPNGSLELGKLSTAGASAGDVPTLVDGEWVPQAPTIPDTGIPDPSTGDEGDMLTVSDGAYVLVPPSGGGGGVEWLTASGSGMTSVSDAWVTLAFIALPDGWLANGASVEYLAEAFCGLNSNAVGMVFRIVLANSSGTVLATIGQMESSFMEPYSTAQGVAIEGGVTVAETTLNARVQRFVARTSAGIDSAASYVETGTLAGSARIAIQATTGVEDAGNVNLVKFRAMVS